MRQPCCISLSVIVTYNMHPNFRDKTSQRFGSLTVASLHGFILSPSGKRVYKWNVVCDCGASLVVRGTNLCVWQYNIMAVLVQGGRSAIVPEHMAFGIIRFFRVEHDEIQMPEPEKPIISKIWRAWNLRFTTDGLHSPILPMICSFLYQDGLTLERIDNDRNYDQTNCRWPHAENKPPTAGVPDLFPNTLGPDECHGSSTKAGIKTSTVQMRMKRGWNENNLLILLP